MQFKSTFTLPEFAPSRRALLRAAAVAPLASLLGTKSASALGFRLRDAPHPVLVRFANLPFKYPHEPILSVADISCNGLLVNPLNLTIPLSTGRYFDHSASGIEVAATNVANLAYKYIKKSASITMFDIEIYRSLNVPIAAGYDPAIHKDQAARYDTRSHYELRLEALRYTTTLLKRTSEIIGASIPNFEVGTYNVPRQFIWYSLGKTSALQKQLQIESQELNALLPQLSFAGPQVQFIIDQRMSDGISNGSITESMLIDWHIKSIQMRKSVFGSSIRIMPLIWPRYFATGGAKYPGNSIALPAGFMTRLCHALLDVGVGGFFCYCSSGDATASIGDQERIRSSWAEVASVVRSRGFRSLS